MALRKTVLSAALALSLGLTAGSALAEVKIGFLATLSGAGAALGQDMVDGFTLALEERGGKLGGQDITFIKEDDQLKPDMGVQAVQKFLEKDKVDIVAGVTFSNVMMAIAKPLADAHMTFVGSNAGPAPLAGNQCNAGFFFAAWQNDEQAEVMGQFATDQKYKNVYMITPNYQSGRDQVKGFTRFYKGRISGEVYTQLGQQDYSAELLALSAAKPEAVWVFLPGGMGVNFVKQYKQFGLMGKIPLLTVSTVDGSTLPALGDAALGAYAGTFWGPDFKNATSEAFVAAFEKKYKRIPSQYAAQAYDSALLIDSAIQKVDGKVDDKQAFRDALRAADYASLRGAYKFNVNGFPIEDFYAFQVAKDAQGKVSLKTIAKPLPDHADAYFEECKL
ncbi:ABC transporter substrate-binding protein [Castellaniella caeni]|uniref:ABC transporter substrate-binding protein n=1 Tax=Castellaniella caeni TaxID=266123 RepID=UPI00082BCDC4|nr:ABC transporter substrate-binding protein [Castellaniella caeni]